MRHMAGWDILCCITLTIADCLKNGDNESKSEAQSFGKSMKLIERIASWVGFDVNATTKPEVVQLREALEEGRQHKRAEDYDQAEACFTRAHDLAHALGDNAILAIVNLHRADLYIRQRRFDEARNLLTRLQEVAQTSGEQAQQAYARVAVGTLALAEDNWNAARTDFEAALRVARSAKAQGAEGRAMGHLADTYLHERNLSYAIHLLRDALPKLNASGDIELSSYFVGRLGQALLMTGQDAEGDQLLGRALRLAEHMKYRPFERMWHLALGQRASQIGHDSEAFKHFKQVLDMLPPESFENADTTQRVDTLREIAKTCLNLDRKEEALTYVQQAVELAPDDPITQGVMGMVLRAVGRSAEALPYLKQSVAAQAQPASAPSNSVPTEMTTDTVANTVAKAADGQVNANDNLTTQSMVLRSLAAAEAETGEGEAALGIYQQALAMAQNQGNRLEEARVLRDLGLFYAGQNQAQAALKTWAAALEIYDSQDYPAQVARLYCDIAGLRTFMGHNQRAMKDYEQALMHLSGIDDLETRGVVLSNAATAYVEQGDVDTAESFFGESIKIAQKLQDRVAEATRRGNYGWFLLVTGRTTRAIAALEYAIKQSETLNLTLHRAVQTSNMGLAQAESDHPEQALELHRQALSWIVSTEVAPTFHNRYWQALIRCNLGHQLLNAAVDGDNATSEAREQFSAALEIGQSIENNELLIRAQTGLGRIAMTEGDLTAAMQSLNEAIALARRALSRRVLAEALRVSAEVNHQNGDDTRAKAQWEEARRLFEILHHPAAQRPPVWLAVDGGEEGD